jgi:hypothetical protein
MCREPPEVTMKTSCVCVPVSLPLLLAIVFTASACNTTNRGSSGNTMPPELVISFGRPTSFGGENFYIECDGTYFKDMLGHFMDEALLMGVIKNGHIRQFTLHYKYGKATTSEQLSMALQVFQRAYANSQVSERVQLTVDVEGS